MPVRSPLPADRAALRELIAPPQGSLFRPEEIACALELMEAVLEAAPGNTYEALVLTDDADRPMAYACFGATPMTDATYDIYWMITRADSRGQGLGGQLLRAVEDVLLKRGVRTIRVETSSLEGQGGARRFYERSNYTVVGRIPDFYRPGDDLIVFAKRLQAIG